jgi:hypothetical protein
VSAPYAEAAWAYRRAGWHGVLPVAALGRQLRGGRTGTGKAPVPAGYTGYAGGFPSGPDVQAWTEGAEAGDNIALRMPPDVYALDVDAYDGKNGAATLEALTAAAGVPLPNTWRSSSRGGDTVAGIYLFRATLPPERLWVNKPGGEGSGIESVHFAHRYAVVHPSIHPSGRTYTWYDPYGRPADLGAIPAALELPELPPAWVELLSKAGRALEGGSASRDATIAVVQLFRPVRADGVRMCEPVRLALNAELERLHAVSTGRGDLHDPALAALLAVVGYGFEGHAGAALTLGQLFDAFVHAGVTCGRRRRDEADDEWFRMVQGAVGKMAATHGGVVAQQCWCEQPPMEADPRFALATIDATIAAADQARYGEAARAAWHDERVMAGSPPDDAAPARAQAAQVIALYLSGRLDELTLQEWRTTLQRDGLPATQFDKLLADSKRARKEQERQTREQQAAAALVAAHERGLLLPSPAEPMDVSRVLIERHLPGGAAAHVHWQGQWYTWTGQHWAANETAWYRQFVYLTAEHAVFETEDGPAKWAPSPRSVNSALDALQHILLRPASLPAERAGIALRNCALVPDELGRLVPTEHSPTRFNLNSLPHDYAPAAECPTWERVLRELFPEPAARQLLAEWFGYVISGRTNLQKLLVVVGPRRSGKSTLARILRALVGPANTVNPTLPQLVSEFGKQPLIESMLAVMTDIDWAIRDARAAAEELKAIVGEDSRTVNRKNRDQWTGTLPTRFMLISNDEPSLPDTSRRAGGTVPAPDPHPQLRW